MYHFKAKLIDSFKAKENIIELFSIFRCNLFLATLPKNSMP